MDKKLVFLMFLTLGGAKADAGDGRAPLRPGELYPEVL